MTWKDDMIKFLGVILAVTIVSFTGTLWQLQLARGDVFKQAQELSDVKRDARAEQKKLAEQIAQLEADLKKAKSEPVVTVVQKTRTVYTGCTPAFAHGRTIGN